MSHLNFKQTRFFYSVYHTCSTIIKYCAVAFLLSACGGAGSSSDDDNTSLSPEQSVIISGRVTFDFVPHSNGTGGLRYEDTFRKPVRGATVKALRNNGFVLATTTSSPDGEYSLRVPRNSNVKIRVEASLLKTEGGSRWNINVVDNTDNQALYVLEGGLASTGSVDTTRNLHASSGWDGTSYTQTRAAAPFAIMDSIYTAIKVIENVDSTVNFPELTVNWSTENRAVNGNITEGEIGTSFFSPSLDAIFLLGRADNDTEEYDASIIIHEFGHYLEDNLFTSNSPGGPHEFNKQLDMRLAFSEGFGNALASMVLDDPIYRDSFGSKQALKSQFSVEDEIPAIFGFSEGWYSEVAIQMALYDIFDTAQDEGDTLAVGFAPIYNGLASNAYRRGPSFTSIFKFADAFIGQSPQFATDLSSLLTSRGVNSTNEFGLAETDNGTVQDALPIYKTHIEGGRPVSVCTTNSVGEFNKVGNTQFIRLTILSTGVKSITVDSGNRGANRDIANVDIFKDGNRVRFFEYTLGSFPQRNTLLFETTGDYVIAYSEDFNLDDNTQTGGRTCSQLSVTGV